MSGNGPELTSLTVDVVAAYVANNVIGTDKLADFIGSVHAALSKSAAGALEPEKVELIPAVPVKKSVTSDYIVCLEDGKQFKSLKRHLKSCYDLTPEEYREKWGLPQDYPMVAPGYASKRSELAKNMGLGQRKSVEVPSQKTSATASAAAPAEKAVKTSSKRGRKAAA